jgi:hypothetical protein
VSLQHDIPAIEGLQPVALAATEDAPPDTSTGHSGSKDVLINEEAENQRANRKLRDVYAQKAYDLACGCIAFWVIAVGATGTVKAFSGEQILSDAVLVAITTGVTVNVLAAFLGVIRGLFPGTERAKKNSD